MEIENLGMKILREFDRVSELYSPEYEEQYIERITPIVEKLLTEVSELVDELQRVESFLRWAKDPVKDIHMVRFIDGMNKFLALIRSV